VTCPDDPELIAEIEHHLHHDESIKVRRHAAIALGEAGGVGAKATLEAVVASAEDAGLVRFAEYALRELAAKAAA
jgi:HEAT repeat protein